MNNGCDCTVTSFSRDIGAQGMVDVFRASLSALFWSMVMLLVCMMIASLILSEACYHFIVDPRQSRDVRESLLKTYGSFTRAMYSFFEITFSGGWPVLIRPLVDDVSVLFALPCLIYIVLVVFAALRLITALLGLTQPPQQLSSVSFLSYLV